MAASASPTLSVRSAKEMVIQKPRWAFWKGLLVGAAIEVPAIAAAVWLGARLGFGDPDVGFMRIMRLTTVFVGLAALLTAGGVGRLAAYVSVERGRRGAILRAARTHAMAGAGLALIAAIPHGHLPASGWQWVITPACGLVFGALCGVSIGAVCSGTTSVGLAEVWSIARKPGETLKQLLDPDDFVRLGSALRTRTTTLFEGIFDPAPRAPAAPAADKQGTSPSTPASTDEPTPPPPPPAEPKPRA